MKWLALVPAGVLAAGMHTLLWRERAPMPLPRAGYIAGVSGGRLVVAGGSYWENGVKIWSDRTDWFDPTTNAWAAGPRLPAPRSDAACAVLDGTLYAFGGGANGGVEDTVCMLRGERWSVADIRLPAARLYAMSAEVAGTVYMFGGLERAGDYRSATRTGWAGRPGAGWKDLRPMPEPARVNAAVAAVDGRIIVAGGATPDGAGVRNLDDAWIYDPRENRWSPLPRLPVARRAWWGLADGSDMLLLGGYTQDFAREIFRLDPRSGTAARAGMLPHALADARFFRIGARIVGAGGESGPKVRGPWTLEATENDTKP